MIEDRPGKPLSSICSLRAERHAGATIVRLHGEFDLSSEARFGEELDLLLEGGPETLVIDLRGLTFLDSTGLRALVSLHNLAQQDGFGYAVLCGDGNVRRVLRETGLDGVLPLIDPDGAVPASESPV